jgi:hypothetical protein
MMPADRVCPARSAIARTDVDPAALEPFRRLVRYLV